MNIRPRSVPYIVTPASGTDHTVLGFRIGLTLSGHMNTDKTDETDETVRALVLPEDDIAELEEFLSWYGTSVWAGCTVNGARGIGVAVSGRVHAVPGLMKLVERDRTASGRGFTGRQFVSLSALCNYVVSYPKTSIADTFNWFEHTHGVITVHDVTLHALLNKYG